jgi:hypothetical protein
MVAFTIEKLNDGISLHLIPLYCSSRTREGN